MTQTIILCGPTASGKSALGLALAERLQTEIISADSMQVYRGLEIGTAAPSREERQRVRHHLVGEVGLDCHFSAAEFRKRALELIESLHRTGKTPLMVGGTGLYIRALVDGLFHAPHDHQTIRSRLKEEAERIGSETMHERLREVDPEAAARIHPRDTRRIVRALEVFEMTGTRISELQQQWKVEKETPEFCLVGLDRDRKDLYRRIESRVDKMFAAGFVEEVQMFVGGGYGSALRRLGALGYVEIMDYLDGQAALEETVGLVKRNTRRFAKRQLTWFRKDKRIKWFRLEPNQDGPEILEELLAYISIV